MNILITKHSLKGEVDLKEYGYGKLLASGTLQNPIKIIVERASEQAIEKVKKAGGSVTVRE